MITKTKLINSFDNLPENLTNDQVIEHIILVEKVQKVISDSENRRINTKEEAKAKFSKWLK